MFDRARSLFAASLGAWAVGVALLGLAGPVASGEPAFQGPELVLLGGGEPKRLVLEVEADGRSLLPSWEEAMAALVRHCDRDGDGVLDEMEAKGLPSPFGLRQLSWGIFRLDGPAPAWRQVDGNGDAKVGVAELSTYYRSRGVGPVLVGLGRPRFTGRLNEALGEALDADHDGQVREEEVAKAGALLEAFDRNGDERLTADELVAGLSYPGTRGTLGLAPTPSALQAAEIPLLLLPPWDDGGRWAEAVAQRFGSTLDVERLRAWRGEAPAYRWVVRLDRSDVASGGSGDSEPAEELAPGAWLTAATEGLAWHLRADEGSLAEDFQAHRKQQEALFSAVDTDLDERVTARDLEDPSRALLALVLPWADRDGDGTLSRVEHDAWLRLLETLSRGWVLITVLDHGRGLFEAIDSDHDGALSARELRSSGKRLEKAGAMVDGVLSLDRLPRTLIGCVSRGHPRTSLAARPPSRPDWFQGMDRNRDGDLSVREWVGDPSLFHDLDVNHDQLLSHHEVMKIQ